MNIMSYPKFEKAIIAIRYWLLAKEWFKVLEAMELASNKHTGLRKDGKTPAFHHQLSVVYYLRTIYKNLLYPEETFIVAFLHDVVEDCSVSIVEIEQLFGKRIADVVKLLTKIDNNTQLYYDNIALDPIASIVKASDRIHNVQSMIGVFTNQKQIEYVKETTTFVIPMIKKARRLFPQQEPIYENAKHFLRCQIQLINAIHSKSII